MPGADRVRDSLVKVRATGSQCVVDRLMSDLRAIPDVHRIVTRGPYQRNDGLVAFYAEVTYAPAGDASRPGVSSAAGEAAPLH